MRTADFDYHLPEELIAQHAICRGSSRLLVVRAEGEDHRSIQDLPELLEPGDLLVLNDTRVLAARLFARRLPGGGRTEILLVEPLDPKRWLALGRPAKKLRSGTRLDFAGRIGATVEQRHDEGRLTLDFDQPLAPLLPELGHVPLPPYIHRPDESDDRDRYQTLWANREGAVAAPTAGLHFDEALLKHLEERGVRRAFVTLHVGIGTFRPVSAEDPRDHPMDSERFEVPSETLAAIDETRARGGRVVAVGTTVVRTLETVARHEAKSRPGRTDLFITPGFEFRLVDALLTNFHLPRSTLLMLACAFAGRERILAAYETAIRERYRFYSYGDAMFLPGPPAAPTK